MFDNQGQSPNRLRALEQYWEVDRSSHYVHRESLGFMAILLRSLFRVQGLCGASLPYIKQRIQIGWEKKKKGKGKKYIYACNVQRETQCRKPTTIDTFLVILPVKLKFFFLIFKITIQKTIHTVSNYRAKLDLGASVETPKKQSSKKMEISITE